MTWQLSPTSMSVSVVTKPVSIFSLGVHLNTINIPQIPRHIAMVLLIYLFYRTLSKSSTIPLGLGCRGGLQGDFMEEEEEIFYSLYPHNTVLTNLNSKSSSDESSTTIEYDNTAANSFGLEGQGYCNQSCSNNQDQSCGGDLR